MISLTAQKALDAYGGRNTWENFKYLEAEVSVKGLAFTLKRRPFLEHAKIRMEIGRPFSKLYPIGKNKNVVGVLEGDNVRLENLAGHTISERKNARKYFPFGRRLFYWDDLDLAYFSNYAFWNYFTFPNLLMNKDIIWIEKKLGVLEATFPDSLPTHNKIQDFFIDMSSGKLIQHNYTVDIISKHAKPANVVLEHSTENGILFASSRLVTPRSKKNIPQKKPILIDIKVHSFKLTNENIMYSSV